VVELSLPIRDQQLRLVDGAAMVISPDGARVLRKRDESAVADAEDLGRRVGAALLANGAREILEQVYGVPVRDSEV
jgi:porphobilinogen deaminase